MNTLLVQLTDLHIREPGRLAYGRLDTAPYLRQAVRSVLALPQAPQAVVLTGDLTDFGRAAEYAHLQDLLAPLAHLPLYVLPGNHDERTALRQAFPALAQLSASGAVQYRVRVGALWLIALDTVVPGASHGSLEPDSLAWLDAELAACQGEPVVVAMHHPPFQTGIGHMDRIGLRQGAPELAAVLQRHPQVQRVICGHLHRSIMTRFGGTLASTAPSVAHQVCLDLDPKARSAWNLEPPGFQVHHWLPGQGLVSHTAASGQYEGPFAFHDPSGALID